MYCDIGIEDTGCAEFDLWVLNEDVVGREGTKGDGTLAWAILCDAVSRSGLASGLGLNNQFESSISA